ncbi:P-II family nitrogen regulator [Stygiobacter electus]|uniref:P-II family nitrogen regulator n=1 Tax=Stygiobacter electus TaxID=3032292 RepID=A0AAE3P2C6_9BACT|nr:P-II family nitrogen regulator [Stygiobacter electus]MBI5476150.1 P-II family nitrogen regulator [Ignavibacteriales bacterium]MDF1613124.1 P-II family nitrogen regulator [Stygiobacter electus]
MKEIKAIIQPFMLTRVVTALHKIEGLPGITISDIKGFGKGGGKKENDDEEGIYDFVPKNKIEIVVQDELAETVVNSIQENAHTGNPGDGKIFVTDVVNVVKIRTNERGKEAI